MHMQLVEVPLALLRSRSLTPSAKLLWITLYVDAKVGRQRSHSPTRLALRTGLARSTVYESLSQLSASGWLLARRKPPVGRRRWQAVQCHIDDRTLVKIPMELVGALRTVSPQAVLCYGLLQATPGFKGTMGQFKWAEFSELTSWHPKTVKRAVRSLIEAGWVATTQKNRLTPVRFRLQHADLARKEDVQRRLERSEYRGEAIMRECLSLFVDSQEFVDNARPGFLVNPSTGERMELDRFYPLHRVAFEFNGQQHYAPTGRFSRRQVDAQRKRDATKRRICMEHGITLIVIKTDELSLATLLQKIGGCLPLRNVRGYERTIDYLENVSSNYRKSARSA